MPSKKSSAADNLLVPVTLIERRIYLIRVQKVMIDTDLAQLYGVPTYRLNEAVKRNRKRFPADFMFQLDKKEAESLTSQFAISKKGRGGRRTLPYAFTEHGAIMAANVLNSPHAVQMNTTCGDAVGWTTPARESFRSWSHGDATERLGRARVNIFVVRAFLKMRALLGDKRE